MIIPNTLIKLDYDPTKDILYVEWPDFEYYSLLELQQILKTVLDTIRHYDINYLMLDARTTVIDISEADYDQIASKFAQDLMQTRIKKVARLITSNAVRERQVEQVREKTKLSVEFKTFDTVDNALNWFKQ
jgi:predicted HAD superfamily phosphohydrolase YqeG